MLVCSWWRLRDVTGMYMGEFGMCVVRVGVGLVCAWWGLVDVGMCVVGVGLSLIHI